MNATLNCYLVSLCSLFRMVQVSEKLNCVQEKNQNQGATDGSMAKDTGCSSRDPEFSSRTHMAGHLNRNGLV